MKLGSQKTDSASLDDIFGHFFEFIRPIINLIDRTVIITDLNLNILEANNLAAEFYGYSSPEELIGTNVIYTWAKYVEFKDEEFIEHHNEILAHPDKMYGGFFTLRNHTGELMLADVRETILTKSGVPVGMCVTTNRYAYQHVTNSCINKAQEKFISLSSHIQMVHEKHDSALVRELHDQLGPLMSTMRHSLGRLEYKLENKLSIRDESISENLKDIDSIMEEAALLIRKISTRLRPEILDDFGLQAAIKWLAQNFEESAGTKCRVFIDSRLSIESKDIETALFRICQEALTNICNHAQASIVRISLEQKHGNLLFKISDNGRGITIEEINSPISFGIMGMKERVRPFKGKVMIHGKPFSGTTLSVIIPMYPKKN